MAKVFDVLEHTADLKFVAYGETLDLCFQNAARAMTSAMVEVVDSESYPYMGQINSRDAYGINEHKTDKHEINKQNFEFESKDNDLDILLHDFLSEILFLFETEDMIFGEFLVRIKNKNIEKTKNKEYILAAVMKGEKFDPNRHKMNTEIKAVTYHDMQIKQINGLWSAQVLCDI